MANTKSKAPPVIDFARESPNPPLHCHIIKPASTEPKSPTAFYGNDPTARLNLVDKVRAACLDKGFFQIINHAVPPSLQDAMFRLAQEFFALPMEEKLKVDKNQNDYHRGYETFRSQAFQGSSRPDLKEGMDFGPDYQPDHPHVKTKRVACGPNLYPQSVENPEQFRNTVDTYLETAIRLADDVLRVLALSLGLHAEHFAQFTKDPCVTVKMLHYPTQDPVVVDDGERGISAHTDFGFVTLLMQDDIGGLQVWDKGTDSWLDVTPIKGAYVVNLGDCMRRWTNDRYSSGLHQVINKSGKDRYSIACFQAGNPDYLVKCLPGCVGDKGERYPPVTVHDYIKERYKDSYERAVALNT
ncbi:hypothetical protein DFP73DRAFT_342076 [Morchella snyderi]|nr:hypothetical protein DFP73DRAFT_342076 [Morchella snyderi]